ncbi:hypothetical protein Kpol_1013p59 [Vanderwaltozyma polyspora DSM 70294]|uniref:Mediator of RNA polymerase II transcription subunit 17 n=1 Tax=Vanderwaltozyma polyspora (strain ATCC 22028 / DSM 70294 / BCRC 21397 / CBS 2163 / NBRC 10782 / NRRL Y-8283 / UCD 57-17) TaxID=436907 RepID=A7THA6_VANPO|nr:uncharacterized protein Kpol_1013p59 [Vanderwaltozyma polyspora DSM 70294]EDO18387.1 hypothetical protein Kpol_1013p59 [Vanderwaltozyma polyspora DSM 70294]
MSDNDSVRLDKEKGIDLALDPNLIALPLYNSSGSPSLKPTLDKEVEGSSENEVQNFKNVDISNKDHLLVNNPYEVFGQMPLDQFIPLILQERGSGFNFADLSEDTLLQEIQNKESSAIDLGEATSDVVDAMDVDFSTDVLGEPTSDINNTTNSEITSKNSDAGLTVGNVDTQNDQVSQEQFIKAKKEMIEGVNLAINESSLALEFVSLLLSSARESAAISSLSPFLKKTVPINSLNSDKIPLEEKTKQDQLALSVLNKGWKLKSLNESRQILKDNYTSISRTLEKEHEYWRKISKYITNKDVIFKLRDKATNQKVLGIKYGYEDSGSTYRRDRGIASLRNNPETGKLELVPLSKGSNEVSYESGNDRFIRVRIYTKIESEDDAVLSGESSFDKIFFETNEQSNSEDIRGQISRLKALIFEKELMYRLKKECTKLISYGVTVENENKIVIELPNERIEIDYLSIQDSSVINHERDAPKINDRRATLILITLRLLLVAMFKKELKQRLESSKRTTNPNIDHDILLIRPVLGKIRHHNHKILLKRILKEHVTVVLDGTTITEVPNDQIPQDKSETITSAVDIHIKKLSKELDAYSELLQIPISNFKIELPNKGRLEITLKSPNYCNATTTVQYLNDSDVIIFDAKFSEFKEIEEFLNFIVHEYIKDKAVTQPVKEETSAI